MMIDSMFIVSSKIHNTQPSNLRRARRKVNVSFNTHSIFSARFRKYGDLDD